MYRRKTGGINRETWRVFVKQNVSPLRSWSPLWLLCHEFIDPHLLSTLPPFNSSLPLTDPRGYDSYLLLWEVETTNLTKTNKFDGIFINLQSVSFDRKPDFNVSFCNAWTLGDTCSSTQRGTSTEGSGSFICPSRIDVMDLDQKQTSKSLH